MQQHLQHGTSSDICSCNSPYHNSDSTCNTKFNQLLQYIHRQQHMQQQQYMHQQEHQRQQKELQHLHTWWQQQMQRQQQQQQQPLGNWTCDSNNTRSSVPNTCVLTNAAVYPTATTRATAMAVSATTLAVPAATDSCKRDIDSTCNNNCISNSIRSKNISRCSSVCKSNSTGTSNDLYSRATARAATTAQNPKTVVTAAALWQLQT